MLELYSDIKSIFQPAQNLILFIARGPLCGDLFLNI